MIYGFLVLRVEVLLRLANLLQRLLGVGLVETRRRDRSFRSPAREQQIRTMLRLPRRRRHDPRRDLSRSSENNFRNTKPPLSSWAIWQVYERSGDAAFVAEMYDAVVRYHQWVVRRARQRSKRPLRSTARPTARPSPPNGKAEWTTPCGSTTWPC